MMHLEDASAVNEAQEQMLTLIDMVLLLLAWVSTDRCW